MHAHLSKRMLAVVSLAAMVAGGLNLPAAAANGASKLSITPVGEQGAFFDLSVNPGERRELTVDLGNHGSSTVAARTYAADAYTINNGGFGARLHDEAVAGDARWIDYPAEVIQLQAGKGVRRTFALTVPNDALPGEHIAALVIENAEPVQGSGSVRINQVLRQVVAVVMDVAGPSQTRLQIGGATHKVSANVSYVAVEVANTGTTRLRPTGEVVLLRSNGSEVRRSHVAMDSFYARTTTVIEAGQSGLLEEGSYRVKVVLDYGDGLRAEGVIPLDVPRVEEIPLVSPDAEEGTESGVNNGGPSVAVLAALAVGLVLVGALGAVLVVTVAQRRRDRCDDARRRATDGTTAAPAGRPRAGAPTR